MQNLKIIDIRATPGDSGFLIDNGESAVLYDSGFGFTGEKIAANIKNFLGSRSLDCIFLTHSHYDHVLGSVHVSEIYPEAKIVSTEYAKKIFDKESAKSVMRDLDRKHALKCGVSEYKDLIDKLHIDITVGDGDKLQCGKMLFETLLLPGHTRCSAGFYLAESKMLLSSETLGVYFDNNTILPSFLVSYQQTLDSFQKASSFDIEKILVPHFGVIEGKEAKEFLHSSREVSVKTAEIIKNILQNGGTGEDAANHLQEILYKENVRPAYPIDAFKLNTRIMIELIEKELINQK